MKKYVFILAMLFTITACCDWRAGADEEQDIYFFLKFITPSGEPVIQDSTGVGLYSYSDISFSDKSGNDVSFQFYNSNGIIRYNQPSIGDTVIMAFEADKEITFSVSFNYTNEECSNPVDELILTFEDQSFVIQIYEDGDIVLDL